MPEGLPEAWLAVYEYPGGPKMVMGIHSSRDEVVEEHGEPGPTDWADSPVLAAVKDDPALDVVHEGLGMANGACVTARENWFTRYSELLEPFLHDPKATRIFTYSGNRLPDAYSTFYSSADGPCLLPEGHEWPVCKGCGERMLFIGQLDFRDAPLDLDLPGKALVFHYCLECMSENEGHYSLVWLNAEPRWHGEGGGKSPVELGRPWLLTDYPYPGDELESIGDPQFSEEQSLYLNFTCYATKVGGHVFWIQDKDVSLDRNGKPMMYIGQFLGTDDVELGDSGIAYLFYSPDTRETKLRMQCF